MNELNKQIKALELMILERKNTANEMKSKFDEAKLLFKNMLDSKDKAFSNEEKREVEAMKDSQIAETAKVIQKFEYETKVLEIEFDYKKRELSITKVMMLKGIDEVFL